MRPQYAQYAGCPSREDRPFFFNPSVPPLALFVNYLRKIPSKGQMNTFKGSLVRATCRVEWDGVSDTQFIRRGTIDGRAAARVLLASALFTHCSESSCSLPPVSPKDVLVKYTRCRKLSRRRCVWWPIAGTTKSDPSRRMLLYLLGTG